MAAICRLSYESHISIYWRGVLVSYECMYGMCVALTC